MSTMSSFLIFFIFVFIIGGWLLSEAISRKSKKIEKLYSKQMNTLNKEQETLKKSIEKEDVRFTRVKKECDELRAFEETIPTLRKNHTRVISDLKHAYLNIDKIRIKLNSKEYSGNPVVHDVMMIIEEYSPNSEDRQIKDEEKMRQTFNSIKDSIVKKDED